jgi:phosphoenolpyruvate synthase/pyruvate phosphate dikinase
VLPVTTAIFIERVCLECEAMKKVKNEMGFLNVKLMIPFAEPWKKEKSIGRDGRQQISSG